MRQHLAFALFDEGEAAEALYHAQAAHVRAPEELPVLALLAKVYERFRFTTAAIEVGERVLRILDSKQLEDLARQHYEHQMQCMLFRSRLFLGDDPAAYEYLAQIVESTLPLSDRTLELAYGLTFRTSSHPEIATKLLLWGPQGGSWSEIMAAQHSSLEQAMVAYWRSRLVRCLQSRLEPST